MIESGEWEILGNKQHPCIHTGARLAPTDLEPCEEPVGQTSPTRRETTAREKIDVTPTLSCDHSHRIFVVLVVRLVSETALYEPAISTPQQGAYMRRAVSVRRARRSAQPTRLHCPSVFVLTPPVSLIAGHFPISPQKKRHANKRQMWKGGGGGGGANRIIYTPIVNIMLRTEVPLVPLVINTRRYFALVETFQPCSSDLNERRTTL